MATTERLRRTLSLAFTLAVVTAGTLLSGCETESSYAAEQEAKRNAPKPPPVFVLRHHVGGTHHRTLIRGDVWLTTYANSLLSISVETGTVLNSVELMPFGTSGAIVELIDASGPGGQGDQLLAVLDGTAVLRVSISDPESPKVLDLRRAQEIGFPPRTVSVAGGEVWIGGDGGVVPWSKVAPSFAEALARSAPADRREVEEAKEAYVPPTPFVAAQAAEAGRGSIRPVVASAAGLVVPIGRRVYALQSGDYVGAASRLDPVPVSEAAKIGQSSIFTYTLQAGESAQVGLMNAEIREIDSRAVPGIVRHVKLFDATLFAITDTDIIAFSISQGPDGPTLGLPTFIAVKGARDMAAITDNDFVVVGSFGRAFYRWRADGRGPGDTFYRASREPSRLTYASTDRRRILAGSIEGSWMYTIGDEVALVNQPLPIESGERLSVSGGWGRATVASDRRSIAVKPIFTAPPSSSGEPPVMNEAGELLWSPSSRGTINGVESFDGKLWVWHQDGIDILLIENGLLRQVGAFRIEGPVNYLFPQRVGGAAAYVSEFGGFGVLDFVERSALAATGGRRLVDVNADGINDVELTKAELDAESMGSDLARIQVPTGRDRDDLDMPSAPRK